MNLITDVSDAIRKLDRDANSTSRRDRARINALLLTIFAELLPMAEWSEIDDAVLDNLARWRVGLGERAGHQLPTADLPDSLMERRA